MRSTARPATACSASHTPAGPRTVCRASATPTRTSRDDGLAIVHNGIIENHETLRAELEREGYTFSSETDTEVIAHRIHYHLKTVGDLFKAVRAHRR